MKTLADLTQRLERHSDIRFDSSDKRLTIRAKDESGFDITVLDEEFQVTVYFEGWHNHFQNMEEALQCVGFGLSDKCRIKVDRRGTTAYRWTLEYRDGDNWKPDDSTSLVFYPYWKTKSVAYLQNHFITADPRA